MDQRIQCKMLCLFICCLLIGYSWQLGKIEPPKSLYNATYKTCEFWKYVKRIRVFNNMARQLLFKSGGNMSLDCPLSVGTYVFKNIHMPPDTGMLKFTNWPNTIYTLLSTVYGHYEINDTIIKSC